MKRQFLGDSYDAVKRLWQEAFSEWAPLLAEPRYIPEDIRDAFTTVTRIPLLDSHRPPVYSIFNDPDTGIRLPDRQNQKEGATHINLVTISSQLSNPAVRCVLTFDQSHHREIGFSSADQRNAKVRWLRTQGFCAFYYVSPHESSTTSLGGAWYSRGSHRGVGMRRPTLRPTGSCA
jgi:hypothetical protein